MPPTVVDANCIKYFQEERLSDSFGMFSRAIGRIVEENLIAVDVDGLALQEYHDCCRPSAVGMNLMDWISDQLVSGKIVTVQQDHSLKKTLSQLGVPRKDLKWPAIALGASSDLILTEDIDLFDPKAKTFDAKKKEKIKRQGGCVSTLLSRKHGIRVRTAACFLEENT
jgi:hypothetical protein